MWIINLYVDFKDLLNGVKKMKKQECIVKEYLIYKGFVDYWVKIYKQEP
jgi:uncharacterized Fe-S cluster-containing MiaB family protein